MRFVNYDQVSLNIKNILKQNELMIVLKNDAYGFGMKEVFEIAYELGVNNYAVNSLYEGECLRKLNPNITILLLGKHKEYEIIKDLNLIGTVNDYDDYLNYKKYGIKMHLEIDLGMNRFGVKTGYLPMINDKDILAIYGHVYSETNMIEKINFIEELAKRYNKKIHIGGSVAVGYSKSMLRVGKCIYDNAFSLVGKIVNIKKVGIGETLGYNFSYKALKEEIIGICDVGYSNGLNIEYNGKVFINKLEYKVIGNCCMNHCFIKIDEKVKIGDGVKFFGIDLEINEFLIKNKIQYYQLFSIK